LIWHGGGGERERERERERGRERGRERERERGREREGERESISRLAFTASPVANDKAACNTRQKRQHPETPTAPSFTAGQTTTTTAAAAAAVKAHRLPGQVRLPLCVPWCRAEVVVCFWRLRGLIGRRCVSSPLITDAAFSHEHRNVIYAISYSQFFGQITKFSHR